MSEMNYYFIQPVYKYTCLKCSFTDYLSPMISFDKAYCPICGNRLLSTPYDYRIELPEKYRDFEPTIIMYSAYDGFPFDGGNYCLGRPYEYHINWDIQKDYENYKMIKCHDWNFNRIIPFYIGSGKLLETELEKRSNISVKCKMCANDCLETINKSSVEDIAKEKALDILIESCTNYLYYKN